MKNLPLINSLNIAILFTCLMAAITKAQIIPDSSLINNSIVNQEGNTFQVTGGTTQGSNLFHSFEQFSLPINTTASFNNATAIKNIFSRVTGNSISYIEGELKTQNTANLFLINSQGIIFGKNASLNLGGSFFATTAESIHFADGTEFNTTITNNSPLLTISAPIGLNLGTNPGKIINRSIYVDPIFGFPVGLQVRPGNSLSLLGGEVNLESGIILIPGEGRIELGAVAAKNFVFLTSEEIGWKLDYQNIDKFEDIKVNSGSIVSFGDMGTEFRVRGRDLTFSANSLIFAESNSGANIELQGRNIIFEQGSQISATTIDSQAGNLVLKGSESVVVQGTNGIFNSLLFNDVIGTATGEQKTITIETKNLILRDGGQIAAATWGLEQGVDLNIDASESVIVEGVALTENGDQFSSGLFAGVLGEGTGNGGTININTTRVVVEDGGQIVSNTEALGNGGDLNIIASESVLLKARDSNTNTISGLFAQVEPTGMGNAGNLTVTTKELTILDGAQVSSIARNTGKGGNIKINASDAIFLSGNSPFETRDILFSFGGIIATAQPGATADTGTIEINTKSLIVDRLTTIAANNRGIGAGGLINLDVEKLTVDRGSFIGAGSLIENNSVDNIRGDSGILTINATESVEVRGNATIRDEIFNSTIFTRSEGTGDAGNLNIITPQLSVSEGGNINVSATGTGEAGSLNVNAQTIILNHGNLSAETQVGDRGNITLDNLHRLLLTNNSEITTNASALATGGNINISSDVITGLENSDITANAIEGIGGRVTIAAQGIFSIEFREQENPETSDITATSERGPDFSGEVKVITPEVDPTSGLLTLPSTPIDADAILAQDICRLEDEKIAGGSSFVITGKGGISPTSLEPLENRDRSVEWADNNNIISQTTAQNSDPQSHQQKSNLIPEAQGWVIGSNGNILLTANLFQVTPQHSIIHHSSCSRAK